MISTQALQHEVQRAEMLTEIQMMKTSEAMANSRAYEAEYAEAKWRWSGQSLSRRQQRLQSRLEDTLTLSVHAEVTVALTHIHGAELAEAKGALATARSEQEAAEASQ